MTFQSVAVTAAATVNSRLVLLHRSSSHFVVKPLISTMQAGYSGVKSMTNTASSRSISFDSILGSDIKILHPTWRRDNTKVKTMTRSFSIVPTKPVMEKLIVKVPTMGDSITEVIFSFLSIFYLFRYEKILQTDLSLSKQLLSFCFREQSWNG
jgi:hypothetical protein